MNPYSGVVDTIFVSIFFSSFFFFWFGLVGQDISVILKAARDVMLLFPMNFNVPMLAKVFTK